MQVCLGSPAKMGYSLHLLHPEGVFIELCLNMPNPYCFGVSGPIICASDNCCCLCGPSYSCAVLSQLQMKQLPAEHHHRDLLVAIVGRELVIGCTVQSLPKTLGEAVEGISPYI